MMTTLRSRIYRQFGQPTGTLGALAGALMARRESNRRRNAWTVDQLDIQPTDRVLEIGHGPGLAVAHAAEKATAGTVVGVDHSEVMHRQALRRNGSAVAAGRAALVRGTVADLADTHSGGFDKAFAVNVFMFWADPVAVLRQVGDLLAPGATIALTTQPRSRGATDDEADATGARMAQALHDAGYTRVDVRILPLRPVNAACATAVWT